MRKKRLITKYTWSLWSSLWYLDTQEHSCKRYTHQYTARGDHANCIRTNKWGGKGRSKAIYYKSKLLKAKGNIEKWFWSLTNIKIANKDAKIYVGGSTTTARNLLFSAHTLCMNYVTITFLLVSSTVRSKQILCFVHGQSQKSQQKPTAKEFVGFHNHFPLLTM